MELTRQELDARRERFISKMDAVFPEWDTALICSKVNQYYFTGTVQDAILLIGKNGACKYFVRRSYDRAKMESPLQNEVFPMGSYRDAAEKFGAELGNTYMELDTVPYAMVQRLGKYFNMQSLGSLEVVIESTRAVKTPYEVYWLERSGAQQHKFMTEEIPGMLREGMTEQELGGKMAEGMICSGVRVNPRFHMFQTEMCVGQYGFGTNSLYPTNFDGPGGMRGADAATPIIGDPNRTLKKGDMVFVDMAFGFKGYHCDKTQLYSFGAEPEKEVAEIHRKCKDIELTIAEQLKPGVVAEEIYNKAMEGLPADFMKNFMGYNGSNVKFLGHGVGLYADELPVIAKGMKMQLEENMLVAVEPKCGMQNVGTIGVEDTFLVTAQGGRCVTGSTCDIIVVK